PAAARVAGGGETSVLTALDSRGAAEEQVTAPPANDVVAGRFERVQRRRVEPALTVDVRLVDVHARSVDRLRDGQPVRDHVDDDLHDRTAQPDGAGAPDDEPRFAGLDDDRGRHHARHPPAWRGDAAAGVEVVLAEHVVHLDPGARHYHAGA